MTTMVRGWLVATALAGITGQLHPFRLTPETSASEVDQ